MPVIFRVWIPEGMRGTDRTLEVMRSLVESGKKSPTVRDLAVSILRGSGVPARDYRGELRALFSWVQSNVRFTQDPLEIECIQSPERLLDTLAGDCDDMAVLLASLAESIGHETVFKVTGSRRVGPMDHVYAMARVGDGFLPMDPSVYHPLGWQPQKIARSKIYERGI